MVEIADGVFDVKLRFVHAYVVIDDDGAAVIDTGTPGNADAIAAVVAQAHRRLDQVHTIMVTHRHADHAGSVARLQRRTGAQVYVHADDLPVVTGARPQPARGLVQRLANRVLPTPEPVAAARPLHGGEVIRGLQAVHTPGHTAGHLSFLLDRDGGVLFAGDAGAGSRGRVKPPPALLTDDPTRAEQSLRMLAELEFRVACFGHGDVLRDGAADRFREFATGARPR
jgi:glyoxylase-like metal-dependent hydrolase (beta-lactamase superfamily II)